VNLSRAEQTDRVMDYAAKSGVLDAAKRIPGIVIWFLVRFCAMTFKGLVFVPPPSLLPSSARTYNPSLGYIVPRPCP